MNNVFGVNVIESRQNLAGDVDDGRSLLIDRKQKDKSQTNREEQEDDAHIHRAKTFDIVAHAATATFHHCVVRRKAQSEKQEVKQDVKKPIAKTKRALRTHVILFVVLKGVKETHNVWMIETVQKLHLLGPAMQRRQTKRERFSEKTTNAQRRGRTNRLRVPPSCVLDE